MIVDDAWNWHIDKKDRVNMRQLQLLLHCCPFPTEMYARDPCGRWNAAMAGTWNALLGTTSVRGASVAETGAGR